MSAGGAHELSDVTLLRRFQAGDEGAFRSLLERHDARLRVRAQARLSPRLRRRISVSDVLQETWIAAHEGLRSVEPQGEDGVRRWLGRVVELKAAQAARRHVGTAKRSLGRESPLPGTHDGPRSAEPSPSECAMGMEEQESVRRALGALPPDYREILVLTRLRGLDLEQASACLGRSREAAKKLYGRALSRFAEVLAALEGTGRD